MKYIVDPDTGHYGLLIRFVISSVDRDAQTILDTIKRTTLEKHISMAWDTELTVTEYSGIPEEDTECVQMLRIISSNKLSVADTDTTGMANQEAGYQTVNIAEDDE